MLKIGLVGHSLCGTNFGVGALAFGEISILEKICSRLGINEYEIVCFETEVKDSYNDDPRVVLEEYNLKNPFATAKQFSKMDILFDISGGDSFSDIYGNKLYLIQLFIKAAVMISRRPYIVAPQTIGPFKSSWARKTGNYYIDKSVAAFARDELSDECLSKKNAKKVVSVTDLGLLMPYERLPKNEQFTVGFNISGLLYQSKALLRDTINYPLLCDEIILHLIQKKIRVLLVPHVVIYSDMGTDNDYFVCKKLAKKYHLPDIPDFYSPKEVKSYISQCDFFIGSRMHATIAAVSSGVPTLPLAYSRKFKGVFKGIGYDATIDLNQSSIEKILQRIDYCISGEYGHLMDVLNSSKDMISRKSEQYADIVESIIMDIYEKG